MRRLLLALLVSCVMAALSAGDGTRTARAVLLDEAAVPSAPAELGAVAPAGPNDAITAKSADDVALTSGALREAVKRLRAGQLPAPDVEVAGRRVRIEILSSLPSAEIRRVVTGLGGVVEGEVPGAVLQATVPYNRLVELEAQPGVQSVRPPLEANVPEGTNGAPRDATAGNGNDDAPASAAHPSRSSATTRTPDASTIRPVRTTS